MSVDRSQGRWEFDENGNVQYIPPEETASYAGSRPNSGSNHRSSGKNKSNDSGWHWILIVLGFCLWWPIGLVLLFTELGGRWPGDKKVQQEVNRAASAAKRAARQFQQAGSKNGHAGWQAVAEEFRTATENAVKGTPAARRQETKKTKKKKQQKQQDDGAAYGLGNVRLFRAIGSIMAACCGFAFVMTLIEELTYFVDWGYFLENVTPSLALTLAGLTFLGVAGGRRRKLKRFQKYMTMVGSKNTVSLEALARSMGCSEKKVEKDLEEMLDRGFWDQGYVDAAQRILVLGELPWEAPPPTEAEPEPEETAQAEDRATATLKHIRNVNDAIANPELSQKIERIEELTAKIFHLLEERPEKAGQLRSFMNYYLPQTLKILENYSKLEAQGIEGENIAEAKQKIEAMMDKVVDGYETQLDKLFADDVLDISADLKVMESMLEKDGLTVDNELKL